MFFQISLYKDIIHDEQKSTLLSGYYGANTLGSYMGSSKIFKFEPTKAF